MKKLKVFFFFCVSFALITSAYSQNSEPDSVSAFDFRIDSLHSTDSTFTKKQNSEKVISLDKVRSRGWGIIIVDSVTTRNPIEIFSNVFYVGAAADINSDKAKNGAFGINLGYRRLQELNKSWGINLLSSLSIFYNAAEDRYANSEIPEETGGKTFTENYLSFSMNFAPSFSTGYGEMFYAGAGFTYLKGRVFENFLSGSYIIHALNNERLMFSQVIGLEKEFSESLCFNLEYSHTKYNNYVSVKLGKRF